MSFTETLQAAVDVESMRLAASLADMLPRMLLAIILIVLLEFNELYQSF